MTIVVNLPPVAKGRPRMTRSGRAYTPRKTRDYEDTVRLIAKRQIKTALTGEIKADIDFYLEPPTSWSKAKKERAVAGCIRPAVKPDLDNLAKAILDALNGGIAYDDDKQIVELNLRKFYGEPRTVLRLEEL